jgi:hypothetical protein
MQAAFEAALRRRITDHPNGKITLPSGSTADAVEIARVLDALTAARQAGER